MQVALVERDVLLLHVHVSANHNLLAVTTLYKLFCLNRYLRKSSLEAPWVLVISPVIAITQYQVKVLPRVADVPIVLLTEEARDNGSLNRHYSIL